ncbi:MAG: hypothetical protein ABR971_09005 [Acidobacteriaceae bacterium]|jgi:hypothetical protein
MKLDLNWRPKTVGENVAYYSVCMLLAASCWFHSGIFGEVMTALAAAIVLAVAGLMVAGRVICRA